MFEALVDEITMLLEYNVIGEMVNKQMDEVVICKIPRSILKLLNDCAPGLDDTNILGLLVSDVRHVTAYTSFIDQP